MVHETGLDAAKGCPHRQVHAFSKRLRLRELRRQFPDSGFVFATERGGPFTTDAVNRLTKRIDERAGLGSRFIATCCDTPAATS